MCLFFLCPKTQEHEHNSLISDLYKEVKYRDQAVQYHAGIEIGGCAFAFLLNDVPVVQYFEEGNGTLNTSAPLNDLILKSGTQNWKLLVYPAFVAGVQTATLSPGTETNITVETLQFYEGGVKDVAPKFSLLETRKRLNKDGGNDYADAGKELMVYGGTFQAKVPYELTGWSSSADLRKENADKLLSDVVTAFKNYGNLLQEGNLEKISGAVSNKEAEIAQAYFLNAGETKDRADKYATGLKNKTLKMQPLQDYTLKIYGEGRLVTLERTRYPFQGQPALYAHYKDEAGDDYEKSYAVYFHRPAPGARLEVIR